MIKLRFIGDLESSSKRARSFVVQISNESYADLKRFPYPDKFYGEVIESKCKGREIGSKSYFVNPFYEMHKYGWPVFVKVND